MRYQSLTNLGAVLLAILVVLTISCATNRMWPEWDMVYYLDMANHGISGNPNLVAPFAYRPGAPLIIGSFARHFHVDTLRAFRYASHLASVLVVLSCFWFARSQRIPAPASFAATLAVCLYLPQIKWPLFAVAMVDIYAYPIYILAFWLLFEGRFLACLFVSAVGLFFKEFLLIPILVQAIVRAIESRRTGLAAMVWPLGLTALVLALCFALPRLLIHVSATWQDIDPINNRATLSRLISYPLSKRRDFNIFFVYCAYWLPTLLLMNKGRLLTVWRRLEGKRLLLGVYLAVHFLLVMYGGTNISIFVSYLVVAQVLVLGLLISEGQVPWWEVALMLPVTSAFNRIWSPIPLPSVNMDEYLSYYGGYHMHVTRRSFTRLAELGLCILGFWLVRGGVLRLQRRGEAADHR